KKKGEEAYSKIRAIIKDLDEEDRMRALAAIEDEATLKNQSMHLDVKVLGADGRKVIETEALLNSGAGGVFMSHKFAEENGLRLHPLERIIKVKNVDGTPNKKGEISQYARGPLAINGRTFLTTFLIAGLGGEAIILGLPWLRKMNPVINWRTRTFQFR
ncbi:hypothetical protein L208DRAFT_1027875, partial [Tricholoma matsutake]